MTTDRRPDVCSNCGEPLEPHGGDLADRPPCPECGSTARTIRRLASDTIAFSNAVGTTRIREWIETNWVRLLAAAVLSAAGFFLAGIVGLVVGAAAVPVGAYAFTRVREIDRR